MKTKHYQLLTIAAILTAAPWSFFGCGDDDSGGPKDASQKMDAHWDGPDAGADSATAADTGAGDSAAAADTGVDAAVGPDGGSGTDASVEPDFGFDIREPVARTVQCATAGENEGMDADWICTFVHKGVSGYVYAAATPVDCTSFGMSPTWIYDNKAYISINGVVSELANSTYETNNHQNDFIEFDYGGSHYKYYHSSIGFGWRACRNMDCIQVYKSDGVTLTEDGCTSVRTLPIVCLPVEAGKKYGPADFADTFACCPGDPELPDQCLPADAG